jgi:abnormal spindle-like microcephaly-associated protein
VQMRKSAIIIQQVVRVWIRGRKRLENNEPIERYEFPEGKTPSNTSSIAPSPQEHCTGDDKTIASATPWQHCDHVDTLKASVAAHILSFDGMDSLCSTAPQQLSNKQSNSITSATQPCKSEHESILHPSSPLGMFESSCRSTARSQLCEVETSNVISVCKLMSEDNMDNGTNISSQVFLEHQQLVSTWIDLPICKESVAAQRIQSAYRRFLNRNLRITAAIKIQSHWRCYSVRKCFTKQVQAIVGIQTSIRLSLYRQACQRNQLSAVRIQQVVRGWLARKRLLG